MATLKQFAKRIRRRGRQVETGVNTAVIQMAQVINQSVVMATPVDTGHARHNWQAEVGTSPTSELDGVDQAGSSTIARNNGKIGARQSGQTVFLSNNVPYIGPLNEGHSAQAAPKFVETAVVEGMAFLRRKKILV